MDKYKWGTVTMLPDGHRLFPKDDDPASIAIADNSGREPQDTDDGVLWLDFNSDLEITKDEGRAIFLIPLVNPNGKKSYSVGDAATVMMLAAEFDWPVSCDDKTYSITKEGK